MKRLIPLFAILLAYRLSHADPQLARESRSVPAFQAIEVAGVIEVEVELGKPVSVEISGEADLLARVTTKVKDGVLVIDTKEKLPKNTHLHAAVTAPDLSSLGLSGVGSLKVTRVANQRLELNLSGVGSLSAKGTTGTLRVVNSGTGDVEARQLVAKVSTVDMTGVGQAVLHTTESIDARLSGVGGIEVYGNPTHVKKKRSGIGDIRIR